MKIPPTLNGARVIMFAVAPAEGFGTYQAADGTEGLITQAAIATYDNNQFYLFSCDSNWNVVGDLLYDSLEKAKEDARRWYDPTACVRSTHPT
jgi:hypothetical protein